MSVSCSCAFCLLKILLYTRGGWGISAQYCLQDVKQEGKDMEGNMRTEQITQAVNMGNETEVQGAAGKEKLFTQEEVNGFIQSRIARLKSQITKDAESEYSQKMADLQAREMKLLTKEKLSDRGMPKELADIITCTDENDLNAKLDALQKIYGSDAKKKEDPTGFIHVGAANTGNVPGPDPVRKAMGLD